MALHNHLLQPQKNYLLNRKKSTPWFLGALRKDLMEHLRPLGMPHGANIAVSLHCSKGETPEKKLQINKVLLV